MSIKNSYIRYLQHFRQTVTLFELHDRFADKNLIALRHDVDHDLDIALEMSWYEHRIGFKATYYILPDAKYWEDQRLVEKCLQIQDFGHEVGLHINILTDWITGVTDNPYTRLMELLTPLREAGLKISGISSHGDKLCYIHNYINYWLFQELRPENPKLSETGRCAEGIAVDDNSNHIKYPETHELQKQKGSKISLWTVSMNRLGINYHATHVPYDRYFTDSGGEWKRSPDPLSLDLSRGRHQVLIHPEYWRGPQKLYFFLSAARSGSKWLSTVLDKASSLVCRHEYLLNHRLENGKVVEDKHTADGFVELQDDHDLAFDLLLEMRSWIEDLEKDYAEINIYLECFLSELRQVFPEAVFIHLHRDPKEVVRSILNRDWYDTPEDNRHPRFAVNGWNGFNQFQRACWYVRSVNENLLAHCSHRLSFKDMVVDPNVLSQILEALDIAFYPRLAAPFFTRVINAGARQDFPNYDRWRRRQKSYFHKTCDQVNQALGYKTWLLKKPSHKIKDLIAYHFNKKDDGASEKARLGSRESTALIVEFSAGTLSPGTRLEIIDDTPTIFPAKGRHSYFLFGGGSWNKSVVKEGWEPVLAHYYRGEIKAQIQNGTARLICLNYDKNGKLLNQRPLVRLQMKKNEYSFSFRPGSAAIRFNIALYMPVNDLPEKVVIKAIRLEQLPLNYND
jgi:hypothetical protein